MKTIARYLLALIFFLVPLTAMASGTGPTLFVSILPQKFFVQQIGGDKFIVEVMVPPGASPHTYEPKPSQMQKLAGARAYFTIGVALEDAWLDRIATINPDMQIVRTEAGIERLAMIEDHGHDHHDEAGAEDGQQGHGEAHQQGGLDPHIWLSPALVKQQALIIRDSLVMLDPDNRELYQENHRRFSQRIDELDGRLRRILKDKKGMKFMVFHPSWGYFAQSYGLQQLPVEIEGKSPKPAYLQNLIELARQHQITVIFAQPQFSRKSAEVIAREIGAEVVLIDPLGENWFDNMTSVADKLSRAVR
jgi:zinc transport system substrate-binding protein